MSLFQRIFGKSCPRVDKHPQHEWQDARFLRWCSGVRRLRLV